MLVTCLSRVRWGSKEEGQKPERERTASSHTPRSAEWRREESQHSGYSASPVSGSRPLDGSSIKATSLQRPWGLDCGLSVQQQVDPLQFKAHQAHSAIPAQTILFLELSLTSLLCVPATLKSRAHHLTLHRTLSIMAGQWSPLCQIHGLNSDGHLGGRRLGLFCWTIHSF